MHSWLADPEVMRYLTWGARTLDDSAGIGLRTECARLILQLAFAHCGARLMQASCDERNLASEGVMKKCGMQRFQEIEASGRRCYRITKSQWFNGTLR